MTVCHCAECCYADDSNAIFVMLSAGSSYAECRRDYFCYAEYRYV